MKVRKLLLIASLILALTISLGGTLAYLTDVDSTVNVMTLGNVDIELKEYQRVVENGKWVAASEYVNDNYKWVPDLLEEYKHAQPLYPAYFADGNIKWDDRDNSNPAGGTEHRQSWKQVDAPGALALFDDSIKGAQDKFVFVENTGHSDAYARVWFAFEQGNLTKQRFSEVIATNIDADHWQWPDAWKNIHKNYEQLTSATIEGQNYIVVPAVYRAKTSDPNGILPAGETSYVSLAQVYMKPEATNKDLESLGETYEILVYAQAVQTQNLPDAATALTAAFGDDHPWQNKDGSDYDVPDLPPTLVKTAEALKTALENGGNVILENDIVLTDEMNITTPANINLNGNTLTVSRLEAKADTTISDGTLEHGKCTYPAVSVSAGTLKLDDVDVNCSEYCNLVTSGTDEAAEYAGIEVWSGKLVMDDCTITVSTDKPRYSNSVFAIGIHAGEVIMNGGSITINSHGSTETQYDYKAVIFAGSDSDKSVTLNHVTIPTSDKAKYLYAWGGHTTLTTTDNVTATDVDARNGGTYTIQ